MFLNLSYPRSSLSFSSGGLGSPAIPPTSNLLRWTQEFDNAVWVASGVVVTPNTTTAPDATLTADTLVFSLAGSLSQTSATAVSTGSGVLLTASVTSSWARFQKSGTFDGAPYTFSVYLKTLVAADTTLLVTRAGGFIQVGVLDFDEVGPYTLFVWGAQLETGSTATDYVARTT